MNLIYSNIETLPHEGYEFFIIAIFSLIISVLMLGFQ